MCEYIKSTCVSRAYQDHLLVSKHVGLSDIVSVFVTMYMLRALSLCLSVCLGLYLSVFVTMYMLRAVANKEL
jgi:hypothetical protein